MTVAAANGLSSIRSLPHGITVAGAAVLVTVGVLIGGLPLEVMAPAVAASVLLASLLFAPMVGLYALLIAIPFSPSVGLEDAGFSISLFEPLAALMILFWLARSMVGRSAGTSDGVVLPRNGLFGAQFALLCALLIAAVGAINTGLAIKETLKWMLLTLAFVFVCVNIRTERQVRIVLAVLFVAACGQALVGVAQFISGYGPPTFAVGGFMRAHGNFAQPNPFAGYLGTVVPLAVAMALVSQPRRFRGLAVATIVCAGIGILLSLSRGAWLGLIVAAAAMAIAWGPRSRRLVPPIALAILLVGLLGVAGALPPALGERVTSITNNFGVFDAREVRPTSDNFSVVERMAHWQAGWDMFLDHPLTGVGPGNYPAVYDRYLVPGWRESLGHAHNYYINMAAEAGMLGLTALLVVLVLAFRGVLQAVAHADGKFQRALAIGLLGSLVVFCVHNMFDNLLVHGVGIQMGMLLGLIGGADPRWLNRVL